MTAAPSKNIREIHGAHVARYRTKVTVADWDGYIVLSVSGAAYPVGLTADEARYIAAQLNAAAERLEKAA